MIVILDKSYDIFLSSSWSRSTQGINGHLFEMIEYYFILKDHMKVGILICEDMTPERIRRVVQEKYDFTYDEIQGLIDNIVFADHPKVVKGNNILIVDGNFTNLSDKFLYFNNILAFPCNDLKFQTMDNITVLQDDRIYGKGKNTINYIKKILLSRYKKIGKSISNNLVYATTNARKLEDKFYHKLEKKYKGNFLLLSNKKVNVSSRFIQEEMPVSDLFEKFDTYIYTPTPNKRDCSPRFIVECKFYRKRVEYYIDYFGVDKGLYWRRHDIENNFESLYLREDDEIVDIVRRTIWNKKNIV